MVSKDTCPIWPLGVRGCYIYIVLKADESWDKDKNFDHSKKLLFLHFCSFLNYRKFFVYLLIIFLNRDKYRECGLAHFSQGFGILAYICLHLILKLTNTQILQIYVWKWLIYAILRNKCQRVEKAGITNCQCRFGCFWKVLDK